MGLFGWFSERKRRREEEEQAWYEEQERLRREEERRARSQGAPEDVVIKTDITYHPTHYNYRVRITNDSQDPMGDIDVTVIADKKVGIPVKKNQNVDMLDPDETVVLDFKIVPILNLGKGNVKAQLSYFDFAEQDRITFNLKTRSIQISCPKIQPMKVDDDLWRIRMTNLDKFEFETEEVTGVASNLFDDLCMSAEHIGFFGTDPFVVPTLYRGIRKFMGTVGEDVYACQIQVIGQEDISKLLMECYAGDPQKAAGVAARIITPLDPHYHLKKSIRSELDPRDLKAAEETSAGKDYDDSEVKVLGKDQKPLVEDRKVVRKRRGAKRQVTQPMPDAAAQPEEEKVEVWETEAPDTAPTMPAEEAPVEEAPAAEGEEEAPAGEVAVAGEPQSVRKIRIVAD
jgi:hypothetical protein